MLEAMGAAGLHNTYRFFASLARKRSSVSRMASVYWYLIDPIFFLLIIVIVVNAALSWLVAFDVVNRHNQVVATIGQFTQSVTAPLLGPIRQFIPPLGGVDITPIILYLLIQFVNLGALRPLMT